jgi:hypothetical protein
MAVGIDDGVAEPVGALAKAGARRRCCRMHARGHRAVSVSADRRRIDRPRDFAPAGANSRSNDSVPRCVVRALNASTHAGEAAAAVQRFQRMRVRDDCVGTGTGPALRHAVALRPRRRVDRGHPCHGRRGASSDTASGQPGNEPQGECRSTGGWRSAIGGLETRERRARVGRRFAAREPEFRGDPMEDRSRVSADCPGPQS